MRYLFERAQMVIQLQSIDHARAEQIMKFGFKGMDSLHIACAERAECDVFLTTDDRLLAISGRCAKDLHVRIANPMKWLDKVDIQTIANQALADRGKESQIAL